MLNLMLYKSNDPGARREIAFLNNYGAILGKSNGSRGTLELRVHACRVAPDRKAKVPLSLYFHDGILGEDLTATVDSNIGDTRQQETGTLDQKPLHQDCGTLYN